MSGYVIKSVIENKAMPYGRGDIESPRPFMDEDGPHNLQRQPPHMQSYNDNVMII